MNAMILRGKMTQATPTGTPASGSAVLHAFPWEPILTYIENNTGGSMFVLLGGTVANPASASNYTFKLTSKVLADGSVAGSNKNITLRNSTMSIYFLDDGGVGTAYTQGTNYNVWGMAEGQPAER